MTGVAPAGFVVRDLIDVSAPGAIPVVTSPAFEVVSSANAWLPATSPVIVFAEGETARAYPISILVRHEVVDDVVEGRPIAVTYFPLADASAVWDRRVGSRALTLRSSGKIYRAVSVLYDVETESLWPQLSGEAVLGPMKGSRLTLLPSMLASFSAFASAYPKGQVMARPQPALDYDQNPYAGYGRRRAPPTDMLLARPHSRLPAMQTIGLGFGRDRTPHGAGHDAGGAFEVATGDGFLTAIPGPVNSPIDARTISTGRTLQIVNWFEHDDATTFARDHRNEIVDVQTESRWTSVGVAAAGPLRGRRLKPVPQIHALWFACAAFYPATSLL